MLHPRNRHSGRYDFPKLIAACPELGEYVGLHRSPTVSVSVLARMVVASVSQIRANDVSNPL